MQTSGEQAAGPELWDDGWQGRARGRAEDQHAGRNWDGALRLLRFFDCGEQQEHEPFALLARNVARGARHRGCRATHGGCAKTDAPAAAGHGRRHRAGKACECLHVGFSLSAYARGRGARVDAHRRGSGEGALPSAHRRAKGCGPGEQDHPSEGERVRPEVP